MSEERPSEDGGDDQGGDQQPDTPSDPVDQPPSPDTKPEGDIEWCIATDNRPRQQRDELLVEEGEANRADQGKRKQGEAPEQVD